MAVCTGVTVSTQWSRLACLLLHLKKTTNSLWADTAVHAMYGLLVYTYAVSTYGVQPCMCVHSQHGSLPLLLLLSVLRMAMAKSCSKRNVPSAFSLKTLACSLTQWWCVLRIRKISKTFYVYSWNRCRVNRASSSVAKNCDHAFSISRLESLSGISLVFIPEVSLYFKLVSVYF